MKKPPVGFSVAKCLDDLGISTAMVLLKDPDSDQVVTVKRGEHIWLIGACRMTEQALIHTWLGTATEPDDDGDI